MTRWILSLAAATGCTTEATYQVLASAELTGPISGPIELIGAGDGAAQHDGFHTLAAYRVRIPDDDAHRVQIWSWSGCDAPPDPLRPFPIADLGEIRRVGEDAHFFAPGVHVGEQTLDLDTETARALVSIVPDSSISLIGAVAVVFAVGADPGPPEQRQACGVFVLPGS